MLRDAGLARVGALRLGGRVEVVLEILLGLVAKAGSSACPNGSTNEGSRRSGDCATDGRTGDRPGSSTGTSAGLIVALCSLTGDRATSGTDGTANDGPNRSTNDGANASAGNRTAGRADGLSAVLVVVVIVEVFGQYVVFLVVGHS